MRKAHQTKSRAFCVLVSIFAFSVSTAHAAAFNFDTGNGALAVVVPRLVPAIRGVSPGANDASIVIRIITLTNNAWFDALAPYHPTAVEPDDYFVTFRPDRATVRRREVRA